MTVLFSLIIGTFASISAFIAAQRKERRAKFWAIICFFVSPLLLILELLPTTSKTPLPPSRRPLLPFIAEWVGVSIILLILFIIILSFLDPSLLD